MGDPVIDEAALDDARRRGRGARWTTASCPPASGRWPLDGEVIAGETVGDVPAGDDTRFVIYSATKAVVASAFWQLLAEGSLALDQKVVDLIPEFGTNGKDVITVEQVLLHTVGLPPRAAVGHGRRRPARPGSRRSPSGG